MKSVWFPFAGMAYAEQEVLRLMYLKQFAGESAVHPLEESRARTRYEIARYVTSFSSCLVGALGTYVYQCLR